MVCFFVVIQYYGEVSASARNDQKNGDEKNSRGRPRDRGRPTTARKCKVHLFTCSLVHLFTNWRILWSHQNKGSLWRQNKALRPRQSVRLSHCSGCCRHRGLVLSYIRYERVNKNRCNGQNFSALFSKHCKLFLHRKIAPSFVA